MSIEQVTIGACALYRGDCRAVLLTLRDNSLDACVTDPPYHLTTEKKGGTGLASLNTASPAGRARISTGFMGKAWDGGDIAHDPAVWREVLRVLKPGAHLVAFGGTRTHHRLMCALEDAGFELRDSLQYLHDDATPAAQFFHSLTPAQQQAYLDLHHPAPLLSWCYGSGFPKSLGVSRMLDKHAGVEREVLGPSPFASRRPHGRGPGESIFNDDNYVEAPGGIPRTAPTTDAAKQWEGFGTSLKPSWEPIILARKPLDGTVVTNVLKWGTGALNIDACRIGNDTTRADRYNDKPALGKSSQYRGASTTHPEVWQVPQGRWPANMVHDGSHEVLARFPQADSARANGNNNNPTHADLPDQLMSWGGRRTTHDFRDTGSAARFYYTAKASPSDRGAGNTHPTVKPVALMRWLIRLVVPPGGTTLDLFGGSGTTGVAAVEEGRGCLLIEQDPTYFQIACKRIAEATAQPDLFHAPVPVTSAVQMPMFSLSTDTNHTRRRPHMSTPLLIHGTAARLPLADASINTIITSPPYYGLRSYLGLEPSVWPGGTYAPLPGLPPLTIPGPQTWEALGACAHVWGPQGYKALTGGTNPHTSTLTTGTRKGQASNAGSYALLSIGAICQRCGAWRGCLGAEETIERYTWHLVLCFRECWRVLKPTGTFWLNLGDAFTSGNRQGHGTRVGYKQQTNRGMNGTADPPRTPQPDGLAPGNLLLMPHRVALAAQADGWVVRNDLVWVKQSPMPESLAGHRWEQARCACVTKNPAREGGPNPDRGDGGLGGDVGGIAAVPYSQAAPDCPTCQGTGRTATPVLRRGSWRHTRAHEYVFMLTKGMGYWANSEAVREAASYGRSDQGNGLYSLARRADPRDTRETPPVTNRGGDPSAGRNPRTALQPPASPADALASLRAWLRTTAPDVLAAYEAAQANPPSVLRPAASPLGLEHYASFPPALVEPLIRASCPERVCQCGQPWAVVVSTVFLPQSPSPINNIRKEPSITQKGLDETNTRTGFPRGSNATTVHGLATTCACPPGTPWAPGVCLDVFSGSGTVGLVARALGRHSVLVEASAAYVALARERLGLTAIAAWEGASRPAMPGETFTDLPLFGG